MITTRLRASALLLAGAALLAGCASTQATKAGSGGGAQTSAASPAPSMSMTPGMVMPDGSTMGAANPADHADTAAVAPSAAAKMICSTEIRSDIAQVLGLKTVPAPRGHWADPVYTCSYRLPMGTFVLSVTEAESPAAAKALATQLRGAHPDARTTAGLTATAFSTPDGLVALVKDNDILQVNASRLPREFGDQQEKRTDFAYEIASDILGCWTEG